MSVEYIFSIAGFFTVAHICIHLQIGCFCVLKFDYATFSVFEISSNFGVAVMDAGSSTRVWDDAVSLLRKL